MANIKTEYAPSSALTITLASLATSLTWVAGRQSTAVDNSSNKYLDYHVAGKITVGTTPTSGTEIRVYAVAMRDDTNWPDGVGATDAAYTVATQGLRDGYARLLARMEVDATTSNEDYYFGPVSVAQQFGGICPRKFVIVVVHNTGVNLNSTGGNHEINITPEYATVA